MEKGGLSGSAGINRPALAGNTVAVFVHRRVLQAANVCGAALNYVYSALSSDIFVYHVVAWFPAVDYVTSECLAHVRCDFWSPPYSSGGSVRFSWISLILVASTSAFAGTPASGVGQPGSVSLGFSGVYQFGGLAIKAHANEHFSAQAMVCGFNFGCDEVGFSSQAILSRPLLSGVGGAVDLVGNVGVGVWYWGIDPENIYLHGLVEVETRFSFLPIALTVGYQPDLVKLSGGTWTPGELSGSMRIYFWGAN